MVPIAPPKLSSAEAARPPAPKFRMNHRSADAARITLPAFPTYAPERRSAVRNTFRTIGVR